jgi:aspartyl/glutamyl-tRNA(Asn/Gln) amidotransferase C subunit
MDESMTDEISPETFAHLVDLASFDFEPDQAEYLRKQLNNQLKAIHELSAIPLDEAVKPSLHGVSYPKDRRQPIRRDECKTFTDREKLVGQMPEFEDGYVIVPDIPHQTLE